MKFMFVEASKSQESFVMEKPSIQQLKASAIRAFRNAVEELKSSLSTEAHHAMHEEIVERIDQYSYQLGYNAYSEKFIRDAIGDLKHMVFRKNVSLH